jgi:hypothetical protein
MTAANYTLADNPATVQLVEQIIVLKAMVNAMTTVAIAREAEIERLTVELSVHTDFSQTPDRDDDLLSRCSAEADVKSAKFADTSEAAP